MMKEHCENFLAYEKFIQDYNHGRKILPLANLFPLVERRTPSRDRFEFK